MSQGPASEFLVRADEVFTADAEGTVPGGAVHVTDGRITRILSAAEADQLVVGSQRLPQVHYVGCTVMPGLVDAHCHITLTGDGKTYEQQVLDPDEMLALIAVSNMERHLASGVTTLRDNGGRNRVAFVVREAISRGYVRGPRLLLSGRPITHSYGHFYWCNGVADGADQIRAAVRQLVAEGADHIKIMASGGATAGNLPYYPSYDAAELRVAVEAAHTLGRLTTAHCRATASILNAIEAGLDCIEHAEFLIPTPEMIEFGLGVASSGRMVYDRSVAEKLLESGMHISFTAQTGGHETLLRLRAQAELEPLSHQEQLRMSALEGYFEMKLGILSRLLDDGALPRLVISTDAGPYDVSFGGLPHGVSLAVAAGMTPEQALRSVTRTAAEACGLAEQIGCLATGRQADLLIVRGNPVEQVEDLWNVEAVYQSGQLVAPTVAKSGVDQRPVSHQLPQSNSRPNY